jgi:hypothetical protein
MPQISVYKIPSSPQLVLLVGGITRRGIGVKMEPMKWVMQQPMHRAIIIIATLIITLKW